MKYHNTFIKNIENIKLNASNKIIIFVDENIYKFY